MKTSIELKPLNVDFMWSAYYVLTYGPLRRKMVSKFILSTYQIGENVLPA